MMQEVKSFKLATGNVSRVMQIAKKLGWVHYEHQEDNRMLSFFTGNKAKGDWIRINVYYTTMTVGTCLTHPTKGKTQLFRRNVTWTELEKILTYPRVHTDKGYYTT